MEIKPAQFIQMSQKRVLKQRKY